MDLGIAGLPVKQDQILVLAVIRALGTDPEQLEELVDGHMVREHESKTGKEEFRQGYFLNERQAHLNTVIEQVLTGKEVKL